jgi:hypothetical protein
MKKGNLKTGVNSKTAVNGKKAPQYFSNNFSANKKKIDIVTENDNFEDELDQMNENLMNKMEMLKLSEKELDAL